VQVVDEHLKRDEVVLVFVGDTYSKSKYQTQEVRAICNLQVKSPRPIVLIFLGASSESVVPATLAEGAYQVVARGEKGTPMPASECAKRIVDHIPGLTWQPEDDLPYDLTCFPMKRTLFDSLARRRTWPGNCTRRE